MHDCRTATTRLDSAPEIPHSVAMTLLGHKTDSMFRKYIRRDDKGMTDVAKTLVHVDRDHTAKHENRNKGGHKSVAVSSDLLRGIMKKR